MRRAITLLVCVAALALALGGQLTVLAVAQNENAKQKAIDQMRSVANALKQCPERKTTHLEDCILRDFYAGPPTNVEWDVVPSKTARSPFQGVIEFTLPSHHGDTPHQSTKIEQECAANSGPHDPSVGLQEMEERARIAREAEEKGPVWREGHYRYEFDVGSDAPELVKMLWVVKDRNNNVVTSPATSCQEYGCADPWCADPSLSDERECWVKEARSIGTAKKGAQPPSGSGAR